MPELSRRLTAQDAAFLYIEKPHLPMHGGAVAIYEGHISREDVMRVLKSRLHLVPRYRQRVVFPPFGIAHPTWEDDPDFDIRNHVEEVMLPAPGDDRVTAQVAADLSAPPLDRSHPLWKIVLLQGREDGNSAMLSTAHHAMVDGVSGVDISLVLNDLTPDAPPPAPAETPWQPRPLPEPLTLMQDALRDVMREAASNWTDEAFRGFRPAELAERQRQLTAALTGSMPYMLQPAPLTPFNGPVSRRRTGAWFECSFQEVRTIRSTLGGTVNDVVLAVDAGALRRYLQAHRFPVDGMELRAMCPVSMRGTEGQASLGNQVSMMLAPLYVGTADPVQCLRQEREAMERLKREGQAAAFYALSDMSRTIPAPVQAFAAAADAPITMFNTVSTNVPGPLIPLYFDGHLLLHSYGLGMLSSNIGLFISIGTYWKLLSFGLMADPGLVPDVWFLAECFEESFAELLDAAKRAGAPPASPVAPAHREAAGTAGRRARM